MDGILVYDDAVVNNTISNFRNVSTDLHGVEAALSAAISQLTSATGFGLLGCSISTADASNSVNACVSEVNGLVNAMRSMQTQILLYDGNDAAIERFLSTLSADEIANASDDLKVLYAQLGKKSASFLERTGATIFTGFASLLEGSLDFGETLVDLGDILTTGAKSIFTGSYDVINKLLGNETSVTKDMWEETKARVSNKKVESIFNSFYDNTEFGQSVKNNAYLFDAVRSIGSGIAYTGGVTALSILTGGLASGAVGAAGSVSAANLAVSGGLMGLSSNTEDAWANGADVGKGLVRGAAGGVWEGAQWFIGGKIGSQGGWGDKLANKIFKGGASTGQISATRVALDAIDSGVEGYVQPALDLIYKDSYINDVGEKVVFSSDATLAEKYSELYDDAGGFSNVLIQAGIGAGGSALGEGLDLAKMLKSDGGVLDVADAVGVGTSATSLSLLDKASRLFTSKDTNLGNIETSSMVGKDIGKDISIDSLNVGGTITDVEFPTGGLNLLDNAEDLFTGKNTTMINSDISLRQVELSDASKFGDVDAKAIFVSDVNAPKYEAAVPTGFSFGEFGEFDDFDVVDVGESVSSAVEDFSLDLRADKLFESKPGVYHFETSASGQQYRVWDDYMKAFNPSENPLYSSISEKFKRVSNGKIDLLRKFQGENEVLSYKTYNGCLRDSIFEYADDGTIKNINISGIYEAKKYDIDKYTRMLKKRFPDYRNSDMDEAVFLKWLDDCKKDVMAIDDMIRSSPMEDATVVFRGETGKDYFKSKYNINADGSIDELRKELVGRTYTTTSSTSTSLTMQAAPIKGSDTEIVYKLYCDKGTPALNMYELGGSIKYDEQEILLASGLEFEIFDVTRENGKLVISAQPGKNYIDPDAKSIFESKLDDIFKRHEDTVRKTFAVLNNQEPEIVLDSKFKKYSDTSEYLKELFKDSDSYDDEYEDYVVEAANIFKSRVYDQKKNSSFVSAGYDELLKLSGMDLQASDKRCIMEELINGDKNIRTMIYENAQVEVRNSLKTMFNIDDEDFAKKVTDSLLGGEEFVQRGIGEGADWNGYVKMMDEHFKGAFQESVNSGKEPVLWSGFEDDTHHAMNAKFTTIEGTTLGEEMYFVDAAYPNWNGIGGVKLEDLWAKLSENYAKNCCTSIDPSTGQRYSSIKFLYPEGKRVDECFGKLFKEVEFHEIVSHGTIDTITMTKVDPSTMEIVDTIDIDISEIVDFYTEQEMMGELCYPEDTFDMFYEKLLEVMS